MQKIVKTMSEINVRENLKTVLANIERASQKRTPELQCIAPILVGASKFKPAEVVVEAYEAGLQHFGENYVQEIEDKAVHPLILQRCTEIKWHFIGHLQSNKINKVLALPHLHLIETVHKEKLADQLNKHWPKFATDGKKLNVMVQVNTSGEEEKSGVAPDGAESLVRFVLNECENLQLHGLMTIGKYGYNPEDGPNPDFLRLKQCRDDICQNLGLDWKQIHLSMGMSSDYEQAIELGSTMVRVGTSIFGERPPK